MNTFILGVLVGAALVVVGITLLLLSHVYTELTAVHAAVKLTLLRIMAVDVRLDKMSQVTQATMQAAETFVDALRQSQSNMMGDGPRYPQDTNMRTDDLRKSFEGGVREFEDENSDEDESDEWEPGKDNSPGA